MAMALRIFVRGLCDEVNANSRHFSELTAAYRIVAFGNAVNVRFSADVAAVAASFPGFSLERLGMELRALLRLAEYDLRRFANNDQVRHSMIMRDQVYHLIGLCNSDRAKDPCAAAQALLRNSILIMINEIARDCLHHCIDRAEEGDEVPNSLAQTVGRWARKGPKAHSLGFAALY